MPKIDKDARIPCTTVAQLHVEADQLISTLGLGEREDTWEKLEYALIRFAAITRGGAYKILPHYMEILGRGDHAVGPQIAACMLSDRGRLSGTATELLQTISKRLAQNFPPLIGIYLDPLLRLLGRPNKVVLKRTQQCLSTIITHCRHPAIIFELSRGLRDDAATCRRGCALAFELTQTEWGREVWTEKSLKCFEDCLRKMAKDKDSEVRQTAKRIWTAYEQNWPERIESFSATVLTPTIRKYLGMGKGDKAKPRIQTVPPAKVPLPPSRSISVASSASSSSAVEPPVPRARAPTHVSKAPRELHKARSIHQLPLVPTAEERLNHQARVARTFETSPNKRNQFGPGIGGGSKAQLPRSLSTMTLPAQQSQHAQGASQKALSQSTRQPATASSPLKSSSSSSSRTNPERPPASKPMSAISLPTHRDTLISKAHAEQAAGKSVKVRSNRRHAQEVLSEEEEEKPLQRWATMMMRNGPTTTTSKKDHSRSVTAPAPAPARAPAAAASPSPVKKPLPPSQHDILPPTTLPEESAQPYLCSTSTATSAAASPSADSLPPSPFLTSSSSNSVRKRVALFEEKSRLERGTTKSPSPTPTLSRVLVQERSRSMSPLAQPTSSITSCSDAHSREDEVQNSSPLIRFRESLGQDTPRGLVKDGDGDETFKVGIKGVSEEDLAELAEVFSADASAERPEQFTASPVDEAAMDADVEQEARESKFVEQQGSSEHRIDDSKAVQRETGSIDDMVVEDPVCASSQFSPNDKDRQSRPTSSAINGTVETPGLIKEDTPPALVEASILSGHQVSPSALPQACKEGDTASEPVADTSSGPSARPATFRSNRAGDDTVFSGTQAGATAVKKTATMDSHSAHTRKPTAVSASVSRPPVPRAPLSRAGRQPFKPTSHTRPTAASLARTVSNTSKASKEDTGKTLQPKPPVHKLGIRTEPKAAPVISAHKEDSGRSTSSRAGPTAPTQAALAKAKTNTGPTLASSASVRSFSGSTMASMSRAAEAKSTVGARSVSGKSTKLPSTVRPLAASTTSTLPPVRPDRIKRKAPLPSFVPTRSKARVPEASKPVVPGPTRPVTGITAKVKTVVARVKAESIPLPISPAERIRLAPHQIPLPRSPTTLHMSPLRKALADTPIKAKVSPAAIIAEPPANTSQVTLAAAGGTIDVDAHLSPIDKWRRSIPPSPVQIWKLDVPASPLAVRRGSLPPSPLAVMQPVPAANDEQTEIDQYGSPAHLSPAARDMGSRDSLKPSSPSPLRARSPNMAAGSPSPLSRSVSAAQAPLVSPSPASHVHTTNAPSPNFNPSGSSGLVGSSSPQDEDDRSPISPFAQDELPSPFLQAQPPSVRSLSPRPQQRLRLSLGSLGSSSSTPSRLRHPPSSPSPLAVASIARVSPEQLISISPSPTAKLSARSAFRVELPLPVDPENGLPSSSSPVTQPSKASTMPAAEDDLDDGEDEDDDEEDDLDGIEFKPRDYHSGVKHVSGSGGRRSLRPKVKNQLVVAVDHDLMEFSSSSRSSKPSVHPGPSDRGGLSTPSKHLTVKTPDKVDRNRSSDLTGPVSGGGMAVHGQRTDVVGSSSPERGAEMLLAKMMVADGGSPMKTKTPSSQRTALGVMNANTPMGDVDGESD